MKQATTAAGTEIRCVHCGTDDRAIRLVQHANTMRQALRRYHEGEITIDQLTREIRFVAATMTSEEDMAAWLNSCRATAVA